MNILLIRPKPHRQTIGLHSVMICEPLELMTLAAVLRKNGFQVTIVDLILERRPLRYFIRKLKPDLVGLTSYISHIGIIKAYAQEIKTLNPRIGVCVGGVHASVCPQGFLDTSIDCVCQSAADFYRYAGCRDLSAALPDRQLPARYRRKYYYLFQTQCALLKTSFGCAYKCTFCFCKEIAPYSARPLSEVMQELASIPQRNIYLVDDNFLFNRDRLEEFADLLTRHRLDKRFLVYGRADFIAAK